MLKVKLEAKPNHDYDLQDYRAWINIPAQFVEVKDLKEASRICSSFIEENDLGAGNWTGGDVYEGENIIARVSYNGRVWEPLPYPQCKEIKV